MRAKLVTGYVPIPGHPRTPKEYGELGEKLSGVPVPKKAFYMRVEDTWLHKFVRGLKWIPSVSQGDNPKKNSLFYHCVNHMKTSWLVQAADEDPDVDFLCWVDYGIFSQPGISNQVIYEMFEKLEQASDNNIYIPGCWDKAPVESTHPCWRFCGSSFAVPRRYVDQLDFAMRREARQHILNTRSVEWEINTLARVEARENLPFRWYLANHDGSQFTSFPDPITTGCKEG